uniref:Capsid protein n=1 Tax=Riboviria sp. TaxID=2585031 RepID=A0A8K1U255_9VIRU|nr:MAG: hypothetical protein 2 [Riboviria sp.]
MNTIAELHRHGGGGIEMNLMQRLDASRQQPKRTTKRKAQQQPRAAPAPKRQKTNLGGSVARPQKFAAAAYSSGQHTGEAKVFRSGKDSCRIVHRELLGSIAGSAGFVIQRAIALNPGLAASFPWLSTQAQAWERYRFNKLRFCYFTRTGSDVPGSFMMAPDYDAADPAPISEAVASSYQDCEEDAPWKDITCSLPQRSLMGDMREKTIRSGQLQPNQDIKTYDAGNLFACTVDGTTVGWGKLWVEYDVTLFQPQVPSGGFQGSGTLDADSNLTSATPFGGAVDQESTGPISVRAVNQVVSISGAQIGQEILVTSTQTGTGITAVAYGSATGMTFKTNLSSVIAASGNSASTNQTFVITAPIATFTLTNTVTTLATSRVIVTALAPAPNF